MKRYLLPENGQFYKANLHCHTTCSDGALTPEEVKRAYMEQGYSIVAYTDHDVFLHHPELAEEQFLPLNGFEIEINEENKPSFDVTKCYHGCFIALDPETVNQPCWHREKYLFGNAPMYREQVRFDENEPDFERAYTPERINEIMKICREKGFFVTYNHPTWSMENYEQYIRYEGMQAMEISNYGCVAAGYDEYNARVYDDILRSGKRIYCISADDNHNRSEPGSRNWDSFGGFVQIKAEKLEYRTITQALQDGNFYASQGPEIRELWFEDGRLHVKCSPADRVYVNFGVRRAGIVYDETGEGVTEASFEIRPTDQYVRLTVVDHKGRRADTNAYFTDELF